MSTPARRLVANARMYSVEPASAAAWRTLVAWVARAADVPLDYVDLAPEEPLEGLWRRDDLGCALMCGYPWAALHTHAASQPRPLAVPVPAVPESRGAPLYRTSIVVRDDAPFASLDALRGRRFAFTTPSSQSGYQAVRTHVAGLGTAGAPYFGSMVGPLVTPRRVVDAVLAGDADAGPLDSYWLAVLQHNEPATAARLRVVESTTWTPLPLFVCAAAVGAAEAGALTRALLAAGATPALAEVRDTLVLASIASAVPASYAALVDRARHADRLGYVVLR